jgi:gas vesicle protein
MSDHSDSGFEFFKGFLFGGIVGAVVALLYAPKSGKEVREDLRKRSLELSDDAEAQLELAKKKAEELLEETKKRIDDLRKESGTTVDEIKGKATEIIEEGKGTIEKEKKRIKDALDAGVSAYKKEKAAKG